MTKVKEWRALDHCDENSQNDSTAPQEGEQSVSNVQESYEWIIIKDSEDINVTTTDIQAAVTLQLGIQVAIAIVLNLSIGDSSRSEKVIQDLKQVVNTRQSNRQKTIVEKSRQVNITTMDTDVAINIQLLLQVLVAIVVRLGVL